MISLKNIPALMIASSSCSSNTNCQSQSTSRSLSTAYTTNINETIPSCRSQHSNSFQSISTTDTEIDIFGLLLDEEDDNCCDYNCETPALCLAPARKERKQIDLSPNSYCSVGNVKIRNDESAEKAKIALRER